MQREIVKLELRRTEITSELAAINKEAAESQVTQGPLKLEHLRVSVTDILRALAQLTRQRFDTWSGWQAPTVNERIPQQLPAKAMRLAEIALAGSTVDEITQQILVSHGLGQFNVDRYSFNNFRKHVQHSLNNLVEARVVYEIDNPHNAEIRWVAGLWSGTDVETLGLVTLAELHIEASREMHDSHAFVGLKIHKR